MTKTNSLPNTVYMFPGLGAEYPKMLTIFCHHYSWAEMLVRQWEDMHGFNVLDNEPDNLKDKEYLRQLRIHCMNLLWWRVVESETPEKYICCGHSLGFYAAIVAAGALTEDQSWFWLTTIFNEAWENFANNSNRISVLTTTVIIDAHCLAKQFNVEIIARNSDQQIVIYGSQSNIKKMCDSLQWASLRNSDLGSVIPFHSIEMTDACRNILKVAEGYRNTFTPPRNVVWSHLTGEQLNSVDSIYQTLLEQPMRAINWRRLIRNLTNRYHPEFIETGPNRMLSQLVRWNSPEAKIRHIDHLRRVSTTYKR